VASRTDHDEVIVLFVAYADERCPCTRQRLCTGARRRRWGRRAGLHPNPQRRRRRSTDVDQPRSPHQTCSSGCQRRAAGEWPATTPEASSAAAPTSRRRGRDPVADDPEHSPCPRPRRRHRIIRTQPGHHRVLEQRPHHSHPPVNRRRCRRTRPSPIRCASPARPAHSLQSIQSNTSGASTAVSARSRPVTNRARFSTSKHTRAPSLG
jgi:hypothetical protein